MKNLLIIIFLSYLSMFAQHNIYFADNRINIDGKYDDWDRTGTLKYSSDKSEKYKNDYEVNFCWNNEHLYALFIVKDKYLIKNERGRGSKLYLNDAVFLYIDSHNDSHSLFDFNDYQFIVDVLGDEAVYKGDKFEFILYGMEANEVNLSNILFNAASNHKGTVNIQHDEDWGYIIEIAIPWAAIGLIPRENMIMKLTIAVHDADYRKIIDNQKENISNHFVGEVVNYPYLKTFKLTGKPNFLYITQNFLTKEWIRFYFFSISISSYLIVYLYRRNRRKVKGLKQ